MSLNGSDRAASAVRFSTQSLVTVLHKGISAAYKKAGGKSESLLKAQITLSHLATSQNTGFLHFPKSKYLLSLLARLIFIKHL